MSRLLYRLSYPVDILARELPGKNRAPMRNRTADLLLTMETLCLLSYRGNAEKLILSPAAEANQKSEKRLTGVTH